MERLSRKLGRAAQRAEHGAVDGLEVSIRYSEVEEFAPTGTGSGLLSAFRLGSSLWSGSGRMAFLPAYSFTGNDGLEIVRYLQSVENSWSPSRDD